MKNKFALLGIIVGTLAVFSAIFQEDIARLIHQSKDKTVLEKSIDKGKDLLNIDRIATSGEEKRKARLVFLILGSIGILLTILSLTQKEPLRLSAISGGISIIAVSWTYVLFGVTIFIVLLLLWLFLHGEF